MKTFKTESYYLARFFVWAFFLLVAVGLSVIFIFWYKESVSQYSYILIMILLNAFAIIVGCNAGANFAFYKICKLEKRNGSA